MYCNKCGNTLNDEMIFCPQCGAQVNQQNKFVANTIIYKLPENDKRLYSISVNDECLTIAGNYWYLKEKEFIKCKNKLDTASINKFIGMGYLTKRSYRKCLLFVLCGSALEIMKVVIDKVNEWIDEINKYLELVDKSISLPGWVNISINILAVICVLLALSLFFSKKKMIEISFTDKRICIPKKSMSEKEFHMLYQSIQIAKTKQN